MTEFPTIQTDELAEFIDADTLDKLRGEFPNAYYTLVEGEEGTVPVIFRRMKDAEVKRAQAMNKDKLRADKMPDTVFADIAIWPRGEEMAALRDACPLMTDQVAALAMEIARGKAPEEAKKLRVSSPKPGAATSTSTRRA